MAWGCSESMKGDLTDFQEDEDDRDVKQLDAQLCSSFQHCIRLML